MNSLQVKKSVRVVLEAFLALALSSHYHNNRKPEKFNQEVSAEMSRLPNVNRGCERTETEVSALSRGKEKSVNSRFFIKYTQINHF